ncbi:unnamed protein product [Didymodactylos carnosus]|uniref:Uncharacterized protein n=1 Tax=Didymodactylos carnosus TaxID=1234261 RepID=A0A816EM49_9BILA|nr:unnamed protein product [Didymodactylos carnosus]CAF4571994.1 unnamed protein product [Didymodactylos carnosus]
MVTPVTKGGLAEQYKKRDCVDVKIHDVDRTNTDPKILPYLILSKEQKGEDIIFYLACQFGLLSTRFTIESLVDLRTACSDELKNLDVFELKDEITLIEASKLFICGAVSGATCDCKTTCATKHCPYKKAGVTCSTKCQSKRGACENTK